MQQRDSPDPPGSQFGMSRNETPAYWTEVGEDVAHHRQIFIKCYCETFAKIVVFHS